MRTRNVKGPTLVAVRTFRADRHPMTHDVGHVLFDPKAWPFTVCQHTTCAPRRITKDKESRPFVYLHTQRVEESCLAPHSERGAGASG